MVQQACQSLVIDAVGQQRVRVEWPVHGGEITRRAERRRRMHGARGRRHSVQLPARVGVAACQQQNGHIAGLVTPHEIKHLERQRWPYTTLYDVMRPLDQLHTVTPATPVMEALETMGRDDVNQLPVVSGSHLDGVITRANVLQFLQTRTELGR